MMMALGRGEKRIERRRPSSSSELTSSAA